MVRPSECPMDMARRQHFNKVSCAIVLCWEGGPFLEHKHDSTSACDFQHIVDPDTFFGPPARAHLQRRRGCVCPSHLLHMASCKHVSCVHGWPPYFRALSLPYRPWSTDPTRRSSFVANRLSDETNDMDDHVEERSKTHVRACARIDETAGELLQRLWARKAPVLRTHVPALDATGGLRAGDAVEVTCVLDERRRDGADVDGECADACLMRFVAACCAHQDAQGLAMDVLWIDCEGRAQPRKLRDLLRRLHRARAVDRDTCEAWTRESLERVTLVRCDSSRDVHACLPLAQRARLVAAQGLHAHVKRERVHATAHGPSSTRASECLLAWLQADAHAVQASLVASSRVLHHPGRRLRDDAPQTWRERVAERRLYVDARRDVGTASRASPARHRCWWSEARLHADEGGAFIDAFWT